MRTIYLVTLNIVNKIVLGILYWGTWVKAGGGLWVARKKSMLQVKRIKSSSFTIVNLKLANQGIEE